VICSESARLWSELVDALSKEISDLTTKAPALRLVIAVPNDRAWIVDGPGIHLEVWRDGPTVKALFREWQETFDIDVDAHSGITFTSNGVPETTWSVKQEILKPLGDFLSGEPSQTVRRRAFGRH
jgi:hypothetical protein